MPSVQVSLALVLSLFVMSLFIVFALRPTILSIVNLKKTLIESEKILTQLETKVGALQKASTQLEALKPFLSTINTSVPNEGANYSPFTIAVESLARETGTQIESETVGPTLLFSRILSPFAPNKNQKIIDLPFSIRVTGGYNATAEFMNKLLKMERVMMIESVTITRESAAKGVTPTVSLNISGNAYYLADEAQLNKALEVKKGKR
jgi:Tfp pilus assembly protein PilO